MSNNDNQHKRDLYLLIRDELCKHSGRCLDNDPEVTAVAKALKKVLLEEYLFLQHAVEEEHAKAEAAYDRGLTAGMESLDIILDGCVKYLQALKTKHSTKE